MHVAYKGALALFPYALGPIMALAHLPHLEV